MSGDLWKADTPFAQVSVIDANHTLALEMQGGGGSQDSQQQTVYFVAPDAYLGDRLTSYGGHLSFTVTFTFA